MAEQRPPRVVNNTDIPLIQEVHYLKMDIISLEEKRKWERKRMENITQHISASPGGGTGRGMDEAMAAISELEERHKALIKQYTIALRRAEKIISRIQSHQMRTFVTMMYLDNIPDGAVQSVLHMSRWSFENARKAVEDAKSMEEVKWFDRYCANE